MFARTTLVAVAALVLAISCCTAAGDQDVRVTTALGVAEGYETDNARIFLGLPFAQPPIGDLRFAEPEAATPWEGVYDATAPKPDCAQQRTGYINFNNISEDCLYLDVYTPLNATSEEPNMPAMMFFFGGTWQWGGASFPFYDGAFDAGLWEDTIFIVINYRLEAFGYFAGSALANASSDGGTGNMGLLDQRMAMTWWQANAKAFGGDPSRLTIFGQSAGAASCSCHMVMPNSWPHFAQGLMESGPLADWVARPLNYSIASSYETAQYLNCTDENDLKCLRAVTMEEIIEAGEHHSVAPFGFGATASVAGGLGFLSPYQKWSPTIDGVEIVDFPATLAAQGKFADKPVMLGSNSDDGTTFINVPHDLNDTGYLDFLSKSFGGDAAAKGLMGLYPPGAFQNPWWAVADLWTDLAMACPARRSANWYSSFPTQNRDNIFLYQWAHTPYITLPDYWLGAFHGSELFFVFDNSETLFAQEPELAIRMNAYWQSFAHFGHPNGFPDRNPWPWPNFTNATDLAQNLDIAMVTTTGLRNVTCNLWDVKTPPLSIYDFY